MQVAFCKSEADLLGYRAGRVDRSTRDIGVEMMRARC